MTHFGCCLCAVDADTVTYFLWTWNLSMNKLQIHRIKILKLRTRITINICVTLKQRDVDLLQYPILQFAEYLDCRFRCQMHQIEFCN